MKHALIVGFLAVFASPVIGNSFGRDDHDEEKAERLLLGQRTLEQSCMICHSSEIIRSQRITEDQWKAELTKMVGWGAPLEENERADLLAYLIANASTSVPTTAPDHVLPAVAKVSTQPHFDPAALGKNPEHGAAVFAVNCASCHGADAKGGQVGNNLVEKPVLTQTDDYQAVVRNGRNKMPAFGPTINSEDVADILAWLRTR